MTDESKIILKQQYPPTLCLDQIRKILHISKRKASWMLNNGIIPCVNNGKQTRQYKVDIEDLIAYIERVECGDSTIIIPSGLFTAKATTKPTISSPTLSPEFREWLSHKWRYSKQILTISEVAELTGYSKKTINCWVNEGKLQSVLLPQNRAIPIECLIDYYLADGHRSRKKSPKHLRLLKKYYEEQASGINK
jgi:predicted DNA-binding transcriptional regulator AlpA